MNRSWQIQPTHCAKGQKSKRNLQKLQISQPKQRKANPMNNNNTFEGKVALVTGGTSGIGKATAIAFARAGAKVVLSGRREKEGAQVVAEIKKLGGDAAFVRADIAKDADVKAMVKLAVEKFGRLYIAFK